MPCNCRKANCLKLYCVCFAQGKACTEQCNCVGCDNHGQHRLSESQQELVDKRSVGKIGCTCKKSGCNKKYCVCYLNGRNCGPACRCANCKNGASCFEHTEMPRSGITREIDTNTCNTEPMDIDVVFPIMPIDARNNWSMDEELTKIQQAFTNGIYDDF